MKKSDLSRLSESYKIGSANFPDQALGLNIGVIGELREEVLSDFSQGPPYGIGWWADYRKLGSQRRILIGDQLYSCVASVYDNMIEAALHLLEYQDALERANDVVAETVEVVNRRVEYSSPRNALQDLAPRIATMHLVGVFRAVAGSLDCLASSIIGVAALKTPIREATLKGVRNCLRDVSVHHLKPLRDLSNDFESAIRAAGPEGWLDWTLDLRNMLVHRGRRVVVSMLEPRAPVLYSADSKPIQRPQAVVHLPRDPIYSDVEVWRQSGTGEPALSVAYLSEPSNLTAQEVIESSACLIRKTTEWLIPFWKWRRSNPQELHQHRSQWPTVAASTLNGFAGYKPGASPLPSDTVGSLHPWDARRFRAAAVEDSTVHEWKTFD